MSTDLALLPDGIEAATDPARYVITACERAKTWLAQALEHGGIEQIIELKSQAEAIRIYTMQKSLGTEAELSAAEIVRRAERCIGLAIRRGQEKGAIPKRGPHRLKETITTTADVFGSPGGSLMRSDTYAMTDGVSDERFEEAIGAAKAEKNLSRANVVRKVRGQNGERWVVVAKLAREGHTSRQIATLVKLHEQTVRGGARKRGIVIHADRVVGKTRRLDSNRIVGEIVRGLDGIEMSFDLIDFAEVDHAEVRQWVKSLEKSMGVLRRLLRKLREVSR